MINHQNWAGAPCWQQARSDSMTSMCKARTIVAACLLSRQGLLRWLWWIWLCLIVPVCANSGWSWVVSRGGSFDTQLYVLSCCLQHIRWWRRHQPHPTIVCLGLYHECLLTKAALSGTTGQYQALDPVLDHTEDTLVDLFNRCKQSITWKNHVQRCTVTWFHRSVNSMVRCTSTFFSLARLDAYFRSWPNWWCNSAFCMHVNSSMEIPHQRINCRWFTHI